LTKEDVTNLGRLLADQIATYSAPWQQPQRPGYSFMPVNPISGKRYKGINGIDLAAQAINAGYTDDRWLTMKQAEVVGATLKPKEPGHPIRYWTFTEQQGGHVIKLDKPKVGLAVVYNATQFDGMPIQPQPIMVPMAEATPFARSLARGQHTRRLEARPAVALAETRD
jgi:putative DNA primase/helicase